MSFLDNGYLESGEFECSVINFTMRDGDLFELHSHAFIELVCIMEGEVEHQFEGKSFLVSKGDVFVLHPGQEHGYKMPREGVCKGYNILFLPSFLAREFHLLNHSSSFVNFYFVEPFLRSTARFTPHIKLGFNEQLELKPFLETIHKEFIQKKPGYRAMVKALMMQLFVFLSRCEQMKSLDTSYLYANAKERTEAVCRFLDIHYAESFNLDQISRLFGLSTSSFKTMFKQYTGTTFVDYRNEVRMKMAMRLLEDTDKTMIEIAQQSGFEDLSHFHHLFKKKNGMTPGSYRRKRLTR